MLAPVPLYFSDSKQGPSGRQTLSDEAPRKAEPGRWGGLWPELWPGPWTQGWKRRGLDRLLPMQREVLDRTGFKDGRNLLLLAPSSSGKTLIAEFGIARALANGKKALYLAPTRALAEQVCAKFEMWIGGAGYRVLCATGDRPESDGPAGRGEFDVLVAVYEKAAHFVALGKLDLHEIGFVAVDEIGTVFERERGGRLDLFVTNLVRHGPGAGASQNAGLRTGYGTGHDARRRATGLQILGLGTPHARSASLAHWLRAELWTDRRRPHPLREGVFDLSRGVFRYRDSATGESAQEDLGFSCLADPNFNSGHSEDNAILATAQEFARRGDRVLIFAPTRNLARGWALGLAAQELDFDCAGVALARCSRANAGSLGDDLARCLAAGIAFHHSNLCRTMRSLVEDAFDEGEVKILVATYTLGIGVNLCADVVLQSSWMMDPDGRGDRPRRVRIDRERFANQGGRAGRLGLATKPGRSILIGGSEQESEKMWHEIILATPGEETSAIPLAGMPRELPVLLLLGLVRPTPYLAIAAGLARTLSALMEEHQDSAGVASERAGSWTDGRDDFRMAGNRGEDGDNGERRGDLQSILSRCADMDLVKRVPGRERGLETGRLSGDSWLLAPLGGVCVAYGIVPESARAIQIWAANYAELAATDPDEKGPFDSSRRFELLLTLASTFEGNRAARANLSSLRRTCIHLPESLTSEEIEDARLGQAIDSRESSGQRPIHGVKREPAPGAALAPMDLALWNAAAALLDWCDGLESRFIEEKYRLCAGALRCTGEQFSRLAAAAGEIARLMGGSKNAVGCVGELATQLTYGITPRGFALAQLGVDGLGRDTIMRLAGEGYDGPRAIADLDAETLGRLVGPDLAEALLDAARRKLSKLDATLISRQRHETSQASADFQVIEIEPVPKTSETTSGEASKKVSPKSSDVASPETPETALFGASGNSSAKIGLVRAPESSSPLQIRSTSGSTPGSTPESTPESMPKPILALDLTSPGLVHARGAEIVLPPLVYELLAVLAESRGNVVTRQALYHRLWPEGGPEDQQLDGHRRSLIARLRPHLGPDAPRVARVIRGIGFRMILDADELSLKR